MAFTLEQKRVHQRGVRENCPGLLDPQPLLRQLELVTTAQPDGPKQGSEPRTEPSPTEMAATLNTSPRNIHRWRQGVRIKWLDADRYAMALGLHASNLWPEAW